MSPESTTAHSPQDLLVIYVDAVGTGETRGLATGDACIALMMEVAHRIGGPVAYRTGDGVLAVFQQPMDGMQAATQLRSAIAEAARSGRLGDPGLRARIGAHYGPTLDDGKEVFGEGPLIATAVNRLARPDQALCTEDTVLALPQDLSWNAHAVSGLKVTALSSAIPVYELGSDVHEGDRPSVDHVDSSQPDPANAYSRLELLRGERSYVCDELTPELTLGRTSANDVVVRSDLTSRHHARIELRRGEFVLEDSSANGTLVISDTGDDFCLRREEWSLKGSGLICLGGTADKNPEGLIRYKCLR